MRITEQLLVNFGPKGFLRFNMAAESWRIRLNTAIPKCPIGRSILWPFVFLIFLYSFAYAGSIIVVPASPLIGEVLQKTGWMSPTGDY